MSTSRPIVMTAIATAAFTLFGFAASWVYRWLPVHNVGTFILLIPCVGGAFIAGQSGTLPLFARAEMFPRLRMLKDRHSRSTTAVGVWIACTGWLAGCALALVLWSPELLRGAILYSVVAVPIGFAIGYVQVRIIERYLVSRKRITRSPIAT